MKKKKKWGIITICILIILCILFGVLSLINKTKNEVISNPVFDQCKEIIISQNEKIDNYFLEQKKQNNVQSIGSLKNEEVFVFLENNMFEFFQKNDLSYSMLAFQEELYNKGFLIIKNYIGYTESSLKEKIQVSKHSSFKMVTLPEIKEQFDTTNLRLHSSNSIEPIYILVSNTNEFGEEIFVLYELINLNRDNVSYQISNINVLNNNKHHSLKRINERMIDNYNNSFFNN